MADLDRPLFADAKDQLARLVADLSEMAAVRWQLTRLEIDAALTSLKRLAIGLGAAVIMAVTATPFVVVCAAEFLPEATRAFWLLMFGLFGLALLIAASLIAWLALRRFRRRFVGLEESLEELREDLVWIEEWLRGEAVGNAKREGPD